MFAYVHAAAQTSNVGKFHTIFDGQFFLLQTEICAIQMYEYLGVGFH